MDKAIGDIDGDGSHEEIVLTKRSFFKYGNEVIIYSIEGTEIYREDFSDLNPWKLVVGDIDGDGIDDISVGVYKKSLFHPVMARRPFIYSFNNSSLQPKWRGSRLSKPFTDYIFYDIDGDNVDEIVAIEFLQSGDKVINTYKWKGFGFEGFIQSIGYRDIDNLEIKDSLIYVRVKDQDEGFGGVLKFNDDKLTIERVKE